MGDVTWTGGHTLQPVLKAEGLEKLKGKLVGKLVVGKLVVGKLVGRGGAKVGGSPEPNEEPYVV
jgi:hypothetical protein